MDPVLVIEHEDLFLVLDGDGPAVVGVFWVLAVAEVVAVVGFMTLLDATHLPSVLQETHQAANGGTHGF